MADRDRRVLVRVVGSYLAASVAWILVSDQVSARWVEAEHPWFQTAKGLFFVGATTALIASVLRAELARRRAADTARQDSEDQLHRVYEASLDPLLILDDQGRILEASPAAIRCYGYSLERLRQMTVSDLTAPRLREQVPQRVAETLQGSTVFSWTHQTADGREIPVEIAAVVTEVGGRRRLVCAIRDLRPRLEAEQEIRVLHRALQARAAELEQRVVERTAELSAALERAEAADRVKTAFLATMSHELRTPLNSIIGFSGILEQELPGPLNPEQRRQLGMVRVSARHLLELVNDVLDLSRIEAGQLPVESVDFDPAPSLARVLQMIEPLASQAGLALQWPVLTPGLAVQGDPRRFEQVLLNLLGNAVKFTGSGHVRLDVLPQPDGVRFEVQDSGPGIAPADQQAIFAPFFQVSSGLSRRHSGTGLGLAISQRLVGLMGGGIGVESQPGQGSTFWFRLPSAPAAGRAL